METQLNSEIEGLAINSSGGTHLAVLGLKNARDRIFTST